MRGRYASATRRPSFAPDVADMAVTIDLGYRERGTVTVTGYVPTFRLALQVKVSPAFRGTLEGQLTVACIWC
jgi:hypothetical protein